MGSVKTKKGIRNRPFYGPWYIYYDKEERKLRRKLFKAVRHKLLFNIPLTDEEIEFKEKLKIESDTPMTSDGGVNYNGRSKRWRDPKVTNRRKRN